MDGNQISSHIYFSTTIARLTLRQWCILKILHKTWEGGNYIESSLNLKSKLTRINNVLNPLFLHTLFPCLYIYKHINYTYAWKHLRDMTMLRLLCYELVSCGYGILSKTISLCFFVHGIISWSNKTILILFGLLVSSSVYKIKINEKKLENLRAV